MSGERCPTCGSPVRVVSTDEGTSYYAPEPGEGLLAAARAYLDAEAEPAYSWAVESQAARAEGRPNREVERMERIIRARVALEEALEAAAPEPTAERLDVELLADGRKWRAAEAEGHIVTFSETGYGLQHPPSCRPDLIGCRFNTFLAEYGEPVMRPGQYRMAFHEIDEMPEFTALARPADETGSER